MSSAPPSPKRPRRSSGAVTLHQVAQQAQVAPITASRALNSPDKVSPEVRQRVQAAVQALGYVPNQLAGGLASTRSRLVAALVPTMAGPVFQPTIQSLTEALHARGYQLLLGQTGYNGGEAQEERMLEALIARRPDGIVLTGVRHSAASRRRLRAAAIPVVETWELCSTPIDMLVGFSHQAVGEAVARFFHRKGFHHWAVLAGDDARARLRSQAFAATAQALGRPMPEAVEVSAPTTLGQGRQALAGLLQRQPAIDALFCSSDLLALGALTEARARGLAVPARLAVMGFGGLDFAADLDPALSTVQIDSAAMGRQAAHFIIERAEQRDPGARVLDLGFSIIERAST